MYFFFFFISTLGLDGKVEVTLIDCDDLISKDGNGKSDPYVVIRIGRYGKMSDVRFNYLICPRFLFVLSHRQTTHSTVKHATLKPVFNEKFKFKVPDDKKKYVLELTCWNKDPVGKDQFMGKCVVE